MLPRFWTPSGGAGVGCGVLTSEASTPRQSTTRTEFAGSMVYTTELARPWMRGLVSSSTAAGTTLGYILGSGTAWLIGRALSGPEKLAWGWRVPFIISILFCLAGWLLRRGLHESQE